MTATRYVDRFGVELEGGWDEYPPARDRLRQDSSVDARGRVYVGECTSRPFTNFEEGMLWIESNYPQHRALTCGLHVHMSFNPHPLCVGYLADSEAYWLSLRRDLETWGKQRNVQRRDFYSRLRGENSYCRSDPGRWEAEDALKGWDTERYQAVNFHALQRHGTIEIRVLPMFSSAKLAAAAVGRVLTATDNYLSQCFSDPVLNEPIEEEADTPEENPDDHVVVEPLAILERAGDVVVPSFDPFAEVL